jgi:LytS/YehU family sensor histidine kinase
MHKATGDRKLYVGVARKGDFLHMFVEDNGIGREKANQMKILGNRRKGGMGMRLTSDRLKLLRTIYGQEVSVDVEDLKDQGQPAGTRVEIRIPCSE